MQELPIAQLEQNIGYTFKKKRLLERALTHKSFCGLDQLHSNERLEFLGDSVLQLCVGEFLYFHYSNDDEGKLTRIRSRAVKRESLAACARSIDLGRFLRFSEGERRSGGADKDSILENAFEALIGAVYLDAGYERVREMILQFLWPILTDKHSKEQDFKTRLQEKVQAMGQSVHYECVSAEGPPHDRIFTVCAKCRGDVLGTGQGRSKKEAELMAAEVAFKTINERGYRSVSEKD